MWGSARWCFSWPPNIEEADCPVPEWPVHSQPGCHSSTSSSTPLSAGWLQTHCSDSTASWLFLPLGDSCCPLRRWERRNHSAFDGASTDSSSQSNMSSHCSLATGRFQQPASLWFQQLWWQQLGSISSSGWQLQQLQQWGAGATFQCFL